MYVPAKFSVQEEAAWGIVAEAGAGMLVVSTPQGIRSVFVPVVARENRRQLVSHVARANPWWHSLTEGTEVVALFLAASAYVSPSFYPSRVESSRVVPTWNYVAAEVRGRLSVRDEPEWLASQVRSVTDQFEVRRSEPWSVEDATPAYVEQLLKAIVGIEIAVDSIQGVSKLSQNRPHIDHDEVREQLSRGGLSERNVAIRMSDDQ